MSSKRLDVLCCCKPENVVGTLPADSIALEVRETVDKDSGIDTGDAFASGHQSVEQLKMIPDFIPVENKGGRKTWKTWRK